MTGTASDWVGIVMLVVMFVATKPVKQQVNKCRNCIEMRMQDAYAFCFAHESKKTAEP